MICLALCWSKTIMHNSGSGNNKIIGKHSCTQYMDVLRALQLNDQIVPAWLSWCNKLLIMPKLCLLLQFICLKFNVKPNHNDTAKRMPNTRHNCFFIHFYDIDNFALVAVDSSGYHFPPGAFLPRASVLVCNHGNVGRAKAKQGKLAS